MFLRVIVLVLCLLLAACNQPTSPTEQPQPSPTMPNNPETPENPTPEAPEDPNKPDPDPADPEDPDKPPTEDEFAAIITLAASDIENYKVIKVEGAAVTQVGLDPEWKLEIGARYKLLNTTKDLHPLQLVDKSGNVLISQFPDLTGAGSLQTDSAIGVVANEESLSFTLSPALAVQLSSYLCYYHSLMTGKTTTN